MNDYCINPPIRLDLSYGTCPGCKFYTSIYLHDFSLCTQLQNALYRVRQLEKELGIE
jgi:hypothetical protein